MRSQVLNWIGIGVLVLSYVASLVYIGFSGAKSSAIGNPNEVTIRFAHLQLEGGVRTAFDKIAGEYMQLHPGVRVEQLTIPERIYPSWLITQLVGETAPDIIELGSGINDERLARFFVPLTDLSGGPNPYNKGTDLEGKPLRDTFFDGMRGGFFPNLFEYYGVPISNGSVRMFYNLDLLHEITGSDAMPQTYEELIALCKRIEQYDHNDHNDHADREHGAGAGAIPIAGSKFNAPMLMATLFSSQTQKLLERLGGPGSMSDPPHRAQDYLSGLWSVDTPDVRSGYRLMREIGQYMQPGFMQLLRDDSTLLFVQGKAVMICTGSGDATSIRQQSAFRLGVAPIPLPSTTDPSFGQYTLGPLSELGNAGPSFGLTRQCAHPEVAWDFLMFMVSQKMGQLWTDQSGWLSSVLGVRINPEVAPFLPQRDGYLNGLSPNMDEGTFPDTNRLYTTNLYKLVGPYGSVDAFVDALREDYPRALESDLRRAAFIGQTIAQRGDTQFAAIAWQARKHPEDAGAARRLNSVLQAAAINDRKYFTNRTAAEAGARFAQ